MICINLLPWRESKLNKMKRILLMQLLLAITFPCVTVAAYRMIEATRITIKSQSLNAYRQANQQVLNKIDSLSSDYQFSEIQQHKRQQFIQIINQKNKLPDILAKLTSQKRAGQVNQLALDYRSVKIIYSTTETDDVLPFFQLLNSYPSFCHVSYDSIGAKVKPKDSVQTDTANYELNAKLCDI